MSYPINYPTPQGANVQIFNGYAAVANANNIFEWVKPQGASFVWFTLIGPGGDGDQSTTGGGSGSVTNFMCPAFLIPDVLNVTTGTPSNNATRITYRQKTGAGYTLLTANHAAGSAAASATAANNFTAMGFYQSVAGQNGTSSTQSASATTFLSGGGNTVTANYDYSTNRNGFFQMQPIIVGVGGTAVAVNANGGIGCGGGPLGRGGNGMVVIITW